MAVNSLSIRAYNIKPSGHTHSYHQLVMPIHGYIEITVGNVSAKVVLGECVVIRSGEYHAFSAHENARFVVVDTDTIPDKIKDSSAIIFRVSPGLTGYLGFIETQLGLPTSQRLEQLMFDTLQQLLSDQELGSQIESRIRNALVYIDQNLASKLSIATLSAVACLSQTQFKALFLEQLGVTAMKYVTQQRMEKAKALLRHTDYPITKISELVGYINLSAFSRRFSEYYGTSPAKIRR